MSFDLMSGLMSGVSFGQGYIQGSDQGQDRQMRQQQMDMLTKQQNMAMLMNRVKYQDEQRNLGYQQDTSHYARQLATDPDTMDLPADQHMDLLAKQRLAQGDYVGATNFATDAINMRQSQIMQEQRKANTAKTVMDSQQKLHGFMGSEMAAAAEAGDENAFNAAKKLALASGHGTPEDQQNLASLQWPTDPAEQQKLANALRMGSMSSRQQARTSYEETRLKQIETTHDAVERNRKIQADLQQQRIDNQKQQAAAKNKAGAGTKAPTQQELDQAIPYLKDLKDQGMSTTDLAQAQQALVSNMKALKKVNPNLTDAQAFQQAKGLLGQDVQTLTVPKTTPFSSDTKKITYKMAGATPQSPIPYHGDKSTLIPGRYYETDSHGVLQFTGTGWRTP